MLFFHSSWLALALITAITGRVAAVKDEGFDYVIVGGGTCGMVLASRLSENPDITVAVIEAGESVQDNATVQNPLEWISLMGSELDYAYPTKPQKGANGRKITLDAGKAVGGSSTINGMTYIRASSEQIDAWETYGADGWNWDKLLPYYKKAEAFTPPTKHQMKLGASYEPSVHGTHGHVATGWFNGTLQGNGAFELMRDTWAELGLHHNREVNDGSEAGFSSWPMTVNVSSMTRSDAARSYFWGKASTRNNLKLFTQTVASHLLWGDKSEAKSGDNLHATGVAVIPANGKMHTISAAKEVILSAGSLRSPLLLERSGVGNPSILKKHNIPIKLSLPSVGENLQEQPNIPMVANVSRSFSGYPTYVAFATAQDLFGEETSSVESKLRASLSSYAKRIARQSHGGVEAKAMEKLLSIQTDLLFKDNVPIGELLMFTTGKVFDIAFWLLLPYSRGSVHVSSGVTAASIASPEIDPKYLDTDFDVAQAVGLAKLARKAFTTGPIGDIFKTEVAPGYEAVPKGASDEKWADYVRSAFNGNSHPIGTLSMMSRELGGVVDSELKVYGLQNVRVVDGSVMPAQVAGHLTSTLYAISERAAEMIAGSGYSP